MPTAKKKILVSDGKKNTREAVAEIFSGAGYEVTSAGSGSETIELLTRGSFDLILCDIDMPRTSGPEIVRMAKALNQRAKVVVVSSGGSPSLRAAVKGAGAFELLDKPLRRTALLDVAKAALKRAPARRKKGEEVSRP